MPGLVNGPRSVLARVRHLGLPGYGDDEVLFMASAMERHLPTHVFEWGTNVGASARIFYETSLMLGFDCEIHTIELPLEEAWRDRDHPGELRYAELLKDIPVHLHLGDGLNIALDLYATLGPRRSLFFLDGCHDTEVVLEELMLIAYRVETISDAVMLVHDTAWRGSGAAVEHFLSITGECYRREEAGSEAGMTALWPA